MHTHFYTEASAHGHILSFSLQNRTFFFFPTHLSGFSLSLNSSGMLNDKQSAENSATDVSEIHLSVKSARVCDF